MFRTIAIALCLAVPAQASDLWNNLVTSALEQSSAQNNGTPAVVRECYASVSACGTFIFFTTPNGRLAKIGTMVSVNGKIVLRFVCRFNETVDIQECINFDTNEKITFLKDADTGKFVPAH